MLTVFNFCENRCVVFVDEGRKWSLPGRISDTVFSPDYSLKAWCCAISIESGISHSDGTSQNLQKSFFTLSLSLQRFLPRVAAQSAVSWNVYLWASDTMSSQYTLQHRWLKISTKYNTKMLTKTKLTWSCTAQLGHLRRRVLDDSELLMTSVDDYRRVKNVHSDTTQLTSAQLLDV